MSVDALDEFIRLAKGRKILEAQLEEVKAAQATFHDILVEEFQNTDTEKVTRNGTTVYLKRQLWASAQDGDYDAACAALRDAGLGDLVRIRFNTNQVSAVIREWDKEGLELPPELADTIKVTEKFTVHAVGGR